MMAQMQGMGGGEGGMPDMDDMPGLEDAAGEPKPDSDDERESAARTAAVCTAPILLCDSGKGDLWWRWQAQLRQAQLRQAAAVAGAVWIAPVWPYSTSRASTAVNVPN